MALSKIERPKGSAWAVVPLVLAAFISTVSMASYKAFRSRPNFVADPNAKFQVKLATENLSEAENVMDFWKKALPEQTGMAYEPIRHTGFTNMTLTLCGQASKWQGTVLCESSGISEIHFDETLFEQLKALAPDEANLAMAYVTAHGIAHDVESKLPAYNATRIQQIKLQKKDADRYLLRVELQADYLAGVYISNSSFNHSDEKTVAAALRAVEAICKDRVEHKATDCQIPDPLTHGTLEQRTRWFMKGFKSGRIKDSNVFSTPTL